MDRTSEVKESQVLRAADVIPPFNNDGPRGADAPGVHIPEFSLADNILTEQRRANSGRRKAPGRVNAEPPQGQPRTVATESPAPEADVPSEEGVQLQRIVADIVARDIAHLCIGPGRPPL